MLCSPRRASHAVQRHARQSRTQPSFSWFCFIVLLILISIPSAHLVRAADAEEEEGDTAAAASNNSFLSLTCVYALGLQSSAGRFFTVAPEAPYTDLFRTAVAHDVQAWLTGSANSSVVEMSTSLKRRTATPTKTMYAQDADVAALETDMFASTEARTVNTTATTTTTTAPTTFAANLALFLRVDGTCRSGQVHATNETKSNSNNKNNNSTILSGTARSAFLSVPDSISVAVTHVQRQFLGKMDWVGAMLEITFRFPTLSSSSSDKSSRIVIAKSADVVLRDARAASAYGMTPAEESSAASKSTPDAPFTDLLAFFDAQGGAGTSTNGAALGTPFNHVVHSFFRDRLTRRAKNSQIDASFLYPDFTFDDLFKAATSSPATAKGAATTNTNNENASTAVYPLALTEHLTRTYGTVASRCVGVSCVFAVVTIVLVLALFFVALIAFFVRLCQRRRQDSSDNKQLLRLEARHRRSIATTTATLPSPAKKKSESAN